MHFLALATDYDGTLATNGRVQAKTVLAMERLRAAGGKLILVTGRVLPELFEAFPQTSLFDRIVAENGGLLCRPQTGEVQLLAPAVPPELAQSLQAHGVLDIVVGQTIVGTWLPYERAVRRSLRELAQPYDLILNKDALMILPRGVDKVSGLRAALEELNLAPEQVVAVGDAENDITMLQWCGCGAAVNNALGAVKQAADVRLHASHGQGVEDLIEALLRGELQGKAG